MEYTERALIRLKRKYGKDELVATLIKRLKESKIENAKLSAEIEHLEFKLSEKEDRKEINREALKEARKEAIYNEVLAHNKKLRNLNERFKQVRDDLLAELKKQQK
jgi:hypothetical protein